MSKVIGSAYIKRGQKSVEKTAEDMFDKIINLKFVRQSGKSFIIRSDYEPVFYDDGTKDGKISFRRCVQKPQIKVSYKQVAETVAIEINIEVTNLFIDYENVNGTSDQSGTKLDAADGDPVVWCIVQMGYIGQFPDWTKKDWTKVDQKNLVQRFYDLNNNDITSEAEVNRGNQIIVQVLTSYTTGLPPDRVTYFQGIVGTFETGLHWNHTDDDLVRGYGDPDLEKQKYSEIEETLFQFITRRYIKPSVLHLTKTDKDGNQSIFIHGYNNYVKPDSSVQPDAYDQPDPETLDTEWTQLPLMENGLMSVDDALQFGVVCAVSEKLRTAPANTLYPSGLTEAEIGALPPIDTVPFHNAQNTVGAQILILQRHYPALRWYAMRDGSYFFYHADQTDEELFTDPEIKERQVKGVVRLPAVYDITLGGTRKIRCPFYTVINPMTTILFESRYSLGSLVGFYYHPKEGDDAYIALLIDITFSTVDEDNLMEITCVDIPKDQAPKVNPETGEVEVGQSQKKEESEVTEGQRKRNAWITTKLEVGTYPYEYYNCWLDIADKAGLYNLSKGDWPDGTPRIGRVLADLKEWNKDGVWNDGRMINSEGISPENNMDGLDIDFQIPWLYKGDIVYYRKPYLPEYDPEDENTEWEEEHPDG